ncbi:MAG: arylsulfatase [Thermoguttaceae bacterium]|nr:arylsulfatase [Thermoguttaceae bacterium]
MLPERLANGVGMQNGRPAGRQWPIAAALLAAAAAFLAGLVGTGQSFAAAPAPNVLIILTDDQGYGDFSCHGNPVLKTPNIDALHAESIRLTDFHVAPMCTPTRGQLLTGMDALRNGATSVTAGRSLIRRGIPTMAEAFASAGYRTGIFGKWHLGDSYPQRPMDRGFQDAVWFLGWGVSSAPEFDNDCFNTRYRRGTEIRQSPGYCTDFWFDEAMAWMRERKRRNERFFCYLPTNAPHGPLWVDAKYAAPYAKTKAADFFGMIANIDENMGRLERMLQESGLRDNTLVIFMTDNGGTAGVNTYNAGMRGRKTQYYDGGHRVPCFVRWPAGGLRGPTDISAPTQIQDLLPTLAELCQFELPQTARPDGLSLAPLLRDAEARLPDRMLVVQYGQTPTAWDSCVIWDRWRLVLGRELYDIRTDPGQADDVAAKHPEVVARMRAHYEKWWAGVQSRLADFEPISLGAEEENPVYLTSSDWQDIYCDNNRHVGQAVGGPRGGPWSILVEREGRYEIELRRWPFHTDCALDSAGPEQTVYGRELPPGKPLPIAAARLDVAGQNFSAKTAGAARGVRFHVDLPAGRTTMQGWFQDASGSDLCGAFYARVCRE